MTKILWLKEDGRFLVEEAEVGDEYVRGKKTKLRILTDRASFFDWPQNKEIPVVTLDALRTMATPKPLLGFHNRRILAAYNSPFPIKARGTQIEGFTERTLDDYFATSDKRAIDDAKKKQKSEEKTTSLMVMGMVGFLLLTGVSAFMLAMSRL